MIEATSNIIFRKNDAPGASGDVIWFVDNPHLVTAIAEQLPDAKIHVMENPTDKDVEATSFRLMTQLPEDGVESGVSILLDEIAKAAKSCADLYLYQIVTIGPISHQGQIFHSFLFRGKFV